eukprot:TRINITY_DN47437_c0_g1_i1.p1 TRINITY_DN47437_c0_g1~~TRINITY_DN47437_c0_g1_i1.p1  ORF type:complete len:253 (-),score=47.28 TRINITY_DN47437_c0_g1_i1:101-859(-)
MVNGVSSHDYNGNRRRTDTSRKQNGVNHSDRGHGSSGHGARNGNAKGPPAHLATFQPFVPSTSFVPRLLTTSMQILTVLAVGVVSWLIQLAARSSSEDAIRAATSVVMFMVSAWGFVTLTIEGWKRDDARAATAAPRYEGVFKRFSEKNGWGLISVPGYHDVRLYREQRDLLDLSLLEEVDFRVEADSYFPGWFKASDVRRIERPLEAFSSEAVSHDASSDSQLVADPKAAAIGRQQRIEEEKLLTCLSMSN